MKYARSHPASEMVDQAGNGRLVEFDCWLFEC
jgi:hypothetical protein